MILFIYFISLLIAGQRYLTGEFIYVIATSLLILYIFYNTREREIKINTNILVISGLLYFFSLISFYPFIHLRLEIKGIFYILFNIIFLLLMASQCGANSISIDYLRISLKRIVIVGVILGLFFIKEIFVNPNFLAILVLIGVIIESHNLYEKRANTIISVILLIVYFYIIFKLNSRGVYLILIMLLLFKINDILKKGRWVITLGLLIILIPIAVSVLFLKAGEPLSFKRFLIYTHSIDTLRESPARGLGPGGLQGIATIKNFVYDTDIVFRNLKKFSDAHSSVINLFLALGFIGGSVILSELVILFRSILNLKKDWLFYVVLAIIFNSIFDITLSCKLILSIFIISIALLINNNGFPRIRISKNILKILIIFILIISLYIFFSDYLWQCFQQTDSTWHLTQIPGFSPWNELFLYNNAVLSYNNGDFNKAEDYITGCVKLAPLDKEYNFLLSEVLYKNKKPFESIKNIKRIERENIFLYDLFEREALCFLSLGMNEKALEVLNYISIIEPYATLPGYFKYNITKNKKYLYKTIYSYYIINNFINKYNYKDDRLHRFRFFAQTQINDMMEEIKNDD
ncbi:MAG: hypothetical protein AB1765_11750 [Candidatus Hydrogenedentota bacterium]